MTEFEFSEWLEQRNFRKAHKHKSKQDEEFLKLTFDQWLEGRNKREKEGQWRTTRDGRKYRL